MAAIDAGVVRQGTQLEQRLPHHRVGAFEHAPAADREQRVGGEQRFVGVEHVGDMVQRVARRLQHARDERADLHRVALLHAQVGVGDGLRVVVGGDDTAIVFLLQFGDAADVIAVMMRHQDIGQRPAFLLQRLDQVIDIDLPAIVEFERPVGGEDAVAAAAKLLSGAKFPVILNGAGVVLAGAIPASQALAERLSASVCVGYQHNDAFPGSHPLFAGPLGYNGSKAAMELIQQADVVLALGTRLNPFSTLPGYGLDYWPKSAQIIQVDINPARIGLTKKVAVGIVGDAKKVATSILAKLMPSAGDHDRQARQDLISTTKSRWAQQLSSMDHENDDPGTTWNERARVAKPKWMSPRMAWRAIQSALPREAIISSDIGNNCAIGNAYPTFDAGRKYLAPGLFGPCGYGLPSIVGAKIGCPDVPVVGFAGDGAFGIAVTELTAIGRKEWPAITMIVFRNYQWGAEKRNSILWYADNFVGTELDPEVSYAGIATACGLIGVQARTMEELTAALHKAIEDQMKHSKTTLIEVMVNQELGEPFRRDAMKKPVEVAGIDPKDMRKQAGA